MKAHLVGGGIASLAAAVHLIRDGGVLGANIHIYEARDRLGGCLLATGTAEMGYVLPGGRVFEAQYRCALELFSLIPSASDPSRSVKHEIEEFHQKFGWYDKARLVGGNARILDAENFGLTIGDKLALTKLLLSPEAFLEGKRLDEWFSPEFFTTNLWFMWTTIMNSLPQHSAAEFRRFMNRFLHILPDIARMTKIYRTRFDQYEAIVEPIQKWLQAQSVNIHTNTRVVDVDFLPSLDIITAQGLSLVSDGRRETVPVAPEDLVFVTNGSQLADFSIGSMTEAPSTIVSGHSWALWETLCRSRKDFGDPMVFFGHPQDSRWITFTVTAKDGTFFDRLKVLTGNETGRGGLISFTESNWLLTIVTFHQPEFFNQPEDVQLWWGFGLYPDKPGNFVKKPMTQCNGEEILKEVLHHLKFENDAATIIGGSNCIPCLLPHVGAIWSVRKHGDRPPVIPKGSTNFAFIGEFAEIPIEAAFTMEYAVRTARVAVAELLKLDRKPPPPYQGLHDPEAVLSALKAVA
jgi:oleate hydratase